LTTVLTSEVVILAMRRVLKQIMRGFSSDGAMPRRMSSYYVFPNIRTN
jgi:hypothetical protein